jgi:hypothetical protein
MRRRADPEWVVWTVILAGILYAIIVLPVVARL